MSLKTLLTIGTIVTIAALIAYSGYQTLRLRSANLQISTLQKSDAAHVSEIQTLRDNWKTVTDAIDRADTYTKTIVEKTQTIKEAVNELPDTKTPIGDATKLVLDDIRLREKSSTANKP